MAKPLSDKYLTDYRRLVTCVDKDEMTSEEKQWKKRQVKKFLELQKYYRKGEL